MPMSTEQKSKAEWSWRIVMSVIGASTMFLVAIIGWFLRDAYAKLEEFDRNIDARVSTLEIIEAEDKASRFTSGDWTSAKNNLDQSIVGLDKRVTRNEDAIFAISKQLEKIDQKLDKIVGSIAR